MKRSRKQTLLILSCGVVSIAAVFVLGFVLGALKGDGFRKATSFTSAAGDSHAIERADVISRLIGRRAPRRAAEGFGKEVRDAVSAGLLERDENRRRYFIELLTEAVSLRDINAAVGYFEALSPSPQKDQFMFSLMRRWGELDGRSALAYAMANANYWQREAALAAVLEGWAKVEPRVAWDWAVAEPGRDLFSSLRINAVVEALVSEDARFAFDRIREIEIDAYRTGALRTMIDSLWDGPGLRDGVQWVVQLEDSMPRALTLSHIARRWAQYLPENAAAWVESLDGDPAQEGTVLALAPVWAADQPEQAMTWAAGLNAGRVRRKALGAVVEQWVAQGAHAPAAEWLNQYPPHADFDEAIQVLALKMSEDDPSAAMTWAESMTDSGGVRDVTISMIAETWLSGDPEGAREYIETADIDNEVRDLLRGRIEHEKIELEAGSILEVVGTTEP